MAKPVEIEILLKDRVSAGLELMQRKLDGLMDKASGSGERVRILEAAISALNTQLAAMGKAGEAANPNLDQSKNIEAVSALEAKIKELQERLRQLDETAENTSSAPAGAEQTVRQYNGLHMSVQQIARELPAATMGLNMFFLAISNNLPILTDEIKRAKAANEELKASGQSTVPVWRQLVGSIFSWQTALMVAITVLSMYGKDIANWIGGLFKAKDATDEVRKSQEEFNAYVRKLDADWCDSVASTAGENIAAYRRLTREYNALGDNMAAKKKFIADNQDAFHGLGFSVAGVTDAENLFVRNTDAVVSALVARAKAAAYGQEITDATQRYIKQTEYNNSTVAGGGYYNRIRAGRNWTTTGTVPEELRGLREGVDYTTASSEAVASFTLTAAGAAKINAQRSKEAADRLKKNNDEAKRQLDSVVNRATEGIKQQTDAEQAVYDSLDLKTYDAAEANKDKDGKKTAENRKKAQAELNKDLISLQQKNQDDEIALMRDGTEKKLAEIDNDYKKRIAEIERQEAEFKEKNKEAGLQGLNSEGLTNEQQNALQKAADNAAKERERQTNGIYLAEAQAMRGYLKQYGTFQQQKLAIAEEYAEKIANAQSEGKRMRLTAERDRAVQQVEINAIKQEIDWSSVFGDFGTMFRDQLQPTIDRLRQMAGSDAFRQSSLEDQKTLHGLIERLEQSNAVWDGDIFKKVSDDIVAYQDAMRRYAEAVENARKAENDYANAQAAHDAALKSGNSAMIQATQAAVDETKAAYMEASGQVKSFGTDVQSATADLNASALQAKNIFEGLASGLQGLSSGSLQGIGNGAMQIDKLFGGELTKDAGNALAKGFQSLLGKNSEAAKTLSAALGDSGLAGEIISAILGVLDMLAEGGVGGIVSGLTDTVLDSVNGILDDVFSGGIVTKPLKSVVDGVGGKLDTVTFGGFGSWFGGGNAKETAEKIARLTESNDYLRTSIDRLTEKMDESAGGKALGYYEEAKDAQERFNENLRQILDAQMRYTSAHHSNAYYWDLDDDSLRQVNALLGTSLANEWTDFSKLTAEQMDEIRTRLPDVWEEMINEGKYGDRFRDDWENYADQAGKVEELTEQLRDNITQTSFDSLRSGFLDTLMDMDSDAQDFADDFSEMMQRALLNFAMGDLMDDRLKEWYESLADDISASGGDWSGIDIGKYRDEWDGMAEEWLGMRDAISEITGYTGDGGGTAQTGKAGAYTAMSQEQGTKLEGLWTTSAMHLSSIDGQMRDVSAQMGTAVDSLRQIEANTGDSAKHLGEIKEDIRKMMRDGVKVK